MPADIVAARFRSLSIVSSGFKFRQICNTEFVMKGRTGVCRIHGKATTVQFGKV
jgi:hypothetical protein